MNLKPVLGQIETDWDSLHGGRLLSVVTFADDHVWYIDAEERGSR